MSIQRSRRPFLRGPGTLRDDRLFIVGCEDTYAPSQYFSFFSIPRVQIHVVAPQGQGMHALGVLRMLEQVHHDEHDERWILLDTDRFTQPNQVAAVLEALRIARSRGIHIALSKPCFEFWLLLHHAPESDVPAHAPCAVVEQQLRGLLGSYSKRSLKAARFPKHLADDACQRARRLDATVAGGEIPQANTTRVYQLWAAIHAKSG